MIELHPGSFGNLQDFATATLPQYHRHGEAVIQNNCTGKTAGSLMPLPVFDDARVFYRVAYQRLEDARILLDRTDRTTAAVYLAGYGVECILKALILSAIANVQHRQKMRATFRGARAHDLGWLKQQYSIQGTPPVPADIARSFAAVNTWTTDMRYQPGTTKRKEAEAFLRAAVTVITWADGRM